MLQGSSDDCHDFSHSCKACHGKYGHMTLDYQSEWYTFRMENSDEIYNQKLLMFKNTSHIII